MSLWLFLFHNYRRANQIDRKLDTQHTQPSSSHDTSTKQPNIEFEPSENAYDATQANFATRKDDTSLEQKDLSRPSGSSDIQTTYQSFRTPEFNASDEHYDELQKSNGLDDNARRDIWSKSGCKCFFINTDFCRPYDEMKSHSMHSSTSY